MTTTTERLASTKQCDLITRLLSERDVPADSREWIARQLTGNTMTVRHASATITHLFGLPTTATPAQAAAPGYYTSGTDFIAVVPNKAGTSTYAKRLMVEHRCGGGYGHFDAEGMTYYCPNPHACSETRAKVSWVYAPGVGRTLAGLEPMTLDEARAFGHLHGSCVVCCRQLTDPKSVEAGIGPVCAKKF